MIDGVAVYEPKNNGEDFVFVDFNKAAEKISAMPRDTIIGQSVCEMFPGVREFGLLKYSNVFLSPENLRITP